MSNKRITTATLPANFQDGQILYGADINKIINILREGINYNRFYLDTLLGGLSGIIVRETAASLPTSGITNGTKGYVYARIDEAGITVGYSSLTVYTFNGGVWTAGDTISIIDIYERLEQGESDIDTLQTGLSTEITNRTNADNTLQGNINDEETARILADSQLQTNINTEANTRFNEDATLQNNINSEEAARINADAQLQSNINSVAGDVSDLDFELNNKISLDEKGAFNGVATLDNQGKIIFEQLPNAVFDSLLFANTLGSFMSGSPATVNLGALMRIALTDATNNNRNIKGFYFVADTPVTIFTGLHQDTVNNIYYLFNLEPAEEGLGYEFNPVTITLETGDWMILTSHTVQGALNSSSYPDIVRFAVVNNTYELASDEVHGIVKLGYTSNGKNEKVDTTSAGLFVNLDDYYDKDETDELIQVAKQIHYYPNTKNDSGSTIFKGDVVQFAGSQGDFIKIKRAVGSEIIANPEALMGLAENDILDGQFGNVVWFGQVKEFNTGSLTLGQTLYFDTSSGSLTTTEPATNKIIVAAVEKVSSGGGSNGILLVRIKWVSRDIDEVDGLTDALAGKSAVGHTHPISDVTNLQTSLDTVGQVDGQNTAIGLQALNVIDTTTNRLNVAIGYQTLFANTTGSNNTALGHRTLFNNITGSDNTALGLRALSNSSSGSNNTALGSSAGRFIANGSSANSTGNDSVFIGADTKALANGQTNQIVIGHNATGIGSNTVTLGNDSIVTTALKGNVGINETSPTAQLEVKSSATNKVSLIVNSQSNPSANLQEWRPNGALRAYMNASGLLGVNQGITNVNGLNNAFISLPTTGTTISRNIADANDALTVNLANASSTGLILDAQAAGTTVASIAKNGTVTAPSVVATSTVKIGAWTLSQNGTSGSLDFVVV
jgi:hypothetical protein